MDHAKATYALSLLRNFIDAEVEASGVSEHYSGQAVETILNDLRDNIRLRLQACERLARGEL